MSGYVKFINPEPVREFITSSGVERTLCLWDTDSTGYTFGGVQEGLVRNLFAQAGIKVIGGVASVGGGQGSWASQSSSGPFRPIKGGAFGIVGTPPSTHADQFNLGDPIGAFPYRYGFVADGSTIAGTVFIFGKVDSVDGGKSPIDLANELNIHYVDRTFDSGAGQFKMFARTYLASGGGWTTVNTTIVGTNTGSIGRRYSTINLAADAGRANRILQYGWEDNGQNIVGPVFAEAVIVESPLETAGVIMQPYIMYGGKRIDQNLTDITAVGETTRRNVASLAVPYLSASKRALYLMTFGQNSDSTISASAWIATLESKIAMAKADFLAVGIDLTILVMVTFHRDIAARDATCDSYRAAAYESAKLLDYSVVDSGENLMTRTELIAAGAGTNVSHPQAIALQEWFQRAFVAAELPSKPWQVIHVSKMQRVLSVS